MVIFTTNKPLKMTACGASALYIIHEHKQGDICLLYGITSVFVKMTLDMHFANMAKSGQLLKISTQQSDCSPQGKTQERLSSVSEKQIRSS